MILLEFRFPDTFLDASLALSAANLQFMIESALDESRPNLIYFFEDDLQTEAQRDALGRARELESKDRNARQHHAVLNLAQPI